VRSEAVTGVLLGVASALAVVVVALVWLGQLRVALILLGGIAGGMTCFGGVRGGDAQRAETPAV